jgi:hypothetical protein
VILFSSLFSIVSLLYNLFLVLPVAFCPVALSHVPNYHGHETSIIGKVFTVCACDEFTHLPKPLFSQAENVTLILEHNSNHSEFVLDAV